jgi:hypothetical protein
MVNKMRIYIDKIAKSRSEKIPNSKTFSAKRTLLALLVVVMLGCSSGKLDRKTASAKISQQLDTMETDVVALIGRIGSQCGYNPQNGAEWTIDPNQDLPVIVPVKAGYATVAADGQDYWRVGLTREGQGAGAHEVKNRHVTRNGCDYSVMAIPVGKPVLVGVTGIFTDNNTSTVEYEWKWKLTDLGRALQANGSVYSNLNARERDLLRELFFSYEPVLHIPVPSDTETNVHQEKANFKKYDDGWRLQLP